MQVEIIKVYGHGDYQNEYVMLKVLEDCDIGKYMIADNTYFDDGGISNKVRHTHWFPDKDVKKGELISLWTRKGVDTTNKNDSGTIVHRFYWGLNQAVWNDDGDCALLFHVNNWSHFKVASTKKS